MKTGNLINAMDFATVRERTLEKSSGVPLERGETVLVAGTRQVPASSSDPYLMRVLVIVMKVVNDIIQIPGDDNDYKAFLVDPRGLDKLSDEETAKIKAAIESANEG